MYLLHMCRIMLVSMAVTPRMWVSLWVSGPINADYLSHRIYPIRTFMYVYYIYKEEYDKQETKQWSSWQEE